MISISLSVDGRGGTDQHCLLLQPDVSAWPRGVSNPFLIVTAADKQGCCTFLVKAYGLQYNSVQLLSSWSHICSLHLEQCSYTLMKKQHGFSRDNKVTVETATLPKYEVVFSNLCRNTSNQNWNHPVSRSIRRIGCIKVKDCQGLLWWFRGISLTCSTWLVKLTRRNTQQSCEVNQCLL